MTDPNLDNNIATILNNLALAFGGHSQVPDEVVGLALRGQFTNNSVFRATSTTEVLEVAARLIAERWDGTNIGAVRASIARGFSLDGFATIR